MIGNMAATQSDEYELFEYPEVAAPPLPSWDVFAGVAMTAGIPANAIVVHSTSEREQSSETTKTETEKAPADALRQSFEKGRMVGFEDGQMAERQAVAALAEAREAQRVQQFARQLENFNAQTIRYFETVEPEVVKLALAVAARILRRESQTDPLLLSGAVRAALGQLSSATSVRLRAPSADHDLWKETIAHLPNLSIKPVVLADDQMCLGECVLESELGSVDLGIASHLAEIERGFFDCVRPNPSVADVIPVREDTSE